jgi:hypothetical protein
MRNSTRMAWGASLPVPGSMATRSFGSTSYGGRVVPSGSLAVAVIASEPPRTPNVPGTSRVRKPLLPMVLKQ